MSGGNGKGKISVIAIHSYKGGTGKTLTAINLATCFALSGKRVALLDLDFAAPSLYTYFSRNLIDSVPSLNQVILDDVEFSSSLYDASDVLDLPGKLYLGYADHSNDQTRQMARRGLREASQDAQKIFKWIDILESEPYAIDLLFLDTAPGLSFLSVNSISACDISVLLMRLVNADLGGTKEMIDGLHSKLASEIILLVNQLPEEFAQGAAAEEIEQLINSFIIDQSYGIKPHFGGIIVKDLQLVKLEAENMLELLRHGQENRDIYVLKHNNAAFTKSIEAVMKKIEDLTS